MKVCQVGFQDLKWIFFPKPIRGVRSTITYMRTGLFAELPGQRCHGLNGRAQDKVDAMFEIIIE